MHPSPVPGDTVAVHDGQCPSLFVSLILCTFTQSWQRPSFPAKKVVPVHRSSMSKSSSCCDASIPATPMRHQPPTSWEEWYLITHAACRQWVSWKIWQQWPCWCRDSVLLHAVRSISYRRKSDRGGARPTPRTGVKDLQGPLPNGYAFPNAAVERVCESVWASSGAFSSRPLRFVLDQSKCRCLIPSIRPPPQIAAGAALSARTIRARQTMSLRLGLCGGGLRHNTDEHSVDP